MSETMNARAPRARIATTCELLVHLARRGARGALALEADGSRSLTITTTPGQAPTGNALYVVFIEARDNGLLTDADGNGLSWTLSAIGRAILRRQRSAGQGAIRAAPAGDPAYIAQQRPGLDPAESPLSWLRRRKDKSGDPLITAIQFQAGERLRADFAFSAMGPRVTANWSATGGSGGSASGLGVEIADNISDAQQRVRRALAAVGPISAGLLVDVCGHLKGLEDIERSRNWPPRSGKIGLQVALSELARHYGMREHGSVSLSSLRHWGVSDFRPSGD